MSDGEGTREPYGDTERELRVFLERAVPRLPAPTDRLGRVRERAERARRRRIAAGAAASVAALALAGALLPGLAGRGGPEVVPPAATPTGPAPVPDEGAAPGERTVRYPQLLGLELRLPASWRALEVGRDARTGALAAGFASPQRLAPYKQPCKPPESDGWCAPFRQLVLDGGALLALRPVIEENEPTTTPRAPAPGDLRAAPVTRSCVLLGGRRQYETVLPTRKPGTGVAVELCLPAGSDERRLDEARRILASARFPEPKDRGLPTGPTAPTGPTGPTAPTGPTGSSA